MRIKFIYTLVIFLNLLPFSYQVFGQEKNDENFTNLGAIAISDKYTVPDNRRAIVFRIRNNTSRSISQIFGRIFMIDKLATAAGKKVVLINNPHKGGNIQKGNPHLPGTIAEWNFILALKARRPNDNLSYTLQVHPRSIFYSNVEPIRKTEEKP
jgi:hypothetical protein